MRKFDWRLQRILEIKEKQEQMARTELMEVTEKIISIRHGIILRQANLKHSLNTFGRLEPAARLGCQELIMRSATMMNEQIQILQKAMQQFEAIRKQKMAKMMELRKFRKNLEKLRLAAFEKYQNDFKKYQQNELDEIASISKARQMLEVSNGQAIRR